MNADTKKTGAAIPVVATVEDFVQWTKGLQGRSLLYRGLANVNWRGESAAYRRIEASEGAPENHRVFKNYTLQLLEKASNRGLRLHEGRMLSHLELLAQLQHFGAATCLIDFTYNPLAALWFACREQSKKDGSKKDGKVVA
ncbi:MAG: FRG domain-containing protein, partial [Alphaproteobacteria bacterium]|nr:FRG domain-containing protein [Alphaproteobacteria bacterium]